MAQVVGKLAMNFLKKKTMKGEKATTKSSCMGDMTAGDKIRAAIRFLQFVMGVTVIGMYAKDLARAHKAGVKADPNWVWAVTSGTLGAISGAILGFSLLKSWFAWAWDLFVWFCFLVTFGIFGKIYIKEDPKNNKDIVRMKHAVWVVLTNMLLWIITTAWGLIIWLKVRKARTGRGDTPV